MYLFHFDLVLQIHSSASKESPCKVVDLGSIPGLRSFPGEGNGSSLQYSNLENSMVCVVHGVRHNWATFTFTVFQVYIRQLGRAGTQLGLMHSCQFHVYAPRLSSPLIYNLEYSFLKITLSPSYSPAYLLWFHLLNFFFVCVWVAQILTMVNCQLTSWGCCHGLNFHRSLTNWTEISWEKNDLAFRIKQDLVGKEEGDPLGESKCFLEKLDEFLEE